MKLFFLKQFLLFCLFALSISAKSQEIHWNDYDSETTYVFEISANEALALLETPSEDSLLYAILREPLDRFIDSWEAVPERGHYVFAKIKKNEVIYTHMQIVPFQVFLFNEYGVPAVQVVDTAGNVLRNTKVEYDHVAIDFDTESNFFRIHKDLQNTNGRFLTVEYDEFTAIFTLNQNLSNSWSRKKTYRSSFSTFYSYLLTDKNRYRPGETVRFKSYAIGADKSPISQPLELWVHVPSGYKKLMSVPPYRPGGFSGEFDLHDSLNMRLNVPYTLQLRNNKGQVISSTGFRYEDYELADAKLTVSLKSDLHFAPHTNELQIEVVDANGLYLTDLEARIKVKRKSVLNSYSNLLILPDVLLEKRIGLLPDAPTTMEIPSEIFGASNCFYEVEVTVYTPNADCLVEENQATFYYSHYDINYSIVGDSICFGFLELGKEKKVQAEIKYNDENSRVVNLPYKEKVNTALKYYTVEVDDPYCRKEIQIASIASGLELSGGIEKDVLDVRLHNPLQLPVSWFLYCGEELLEKGSGAYFHFLRKKIALNRVYYIELFYTLGGREQVFRRSFAPAIDELLVDIDLPEKIYPGQQLQAEIEVTDSRGKPVQNVDLTAFSTNSQLNYNVPDISYWGARPLPRQTRASYLLNRNEPTYVLPLNYSFWNKIAGLEQRTYYRFTYPKGTMFSYEKTEPDTVARFVPFVMKNGKPIDIYVIEQNDEPIYFSWTNNSKTYSFVASPGFQTIKLRMADRVIILDSLKFSKGKTTIFSIDMEDLPPQARELKFKENKFTYRESNFYRSYIARFPVPTNRLQKAYLTQGEQHILIYQREPLSYPKSILAGPISPGISRYNDGVEYRHEGGYSYAFEGNVVYKEQEDVVPKQLVFTSGKSTKQMEELFNSNPMIEEKNTIFHHRSVWNPQYISLLGCLQSICIHLPVDADSTGLANLLFRNSDLPDRVTFYHKSGKDISELLPGDYDVILLYNSGNYMVYNRVPIHDSTYVAIDMRHMEMQASNSMSQAWLLEDPYKDIRVNHYVDTRGRYGFNFIRGVVYDESGETIPGAAIWIEGTERRTSSDFDGYFELAAESNLVTLVVSYIGMKNRRIMARSGSMIEVYLEEDSIIFEEVVVTGYQRMDQLLSTRATNSIQVKDTDNPEVEEDKQDEQVLEDAVDILYQELLQINRLRENFSDVGFWEPRLSTDKKGKAVFQVTFPDDITRWDAVVYAMNPQLKTGMVRKQIHSYKPLMAEVKFPRFLTQGDSSNFIGNIRNQSIQKPLRGEICFIQDLNTIFRKPISLREGHMDELPVAVGNKDSISITYLFTGADGYQDGEKRKIPVLPQGVEKVVGGIRFLENGDTISYAADENEERYITISGNQLNFYLESIEYLINYEYACNEQLASKLVGLLGHRLYVLRRGEVFAYDRQVNEIIRRLLNNQNSDRLWSWWGNSSVSSLWMSAHILQALGMAKEAGYPVDFANASTYLKYTDISSYWQLSIADIEIYNILLRFGFFKAEREVLQLFDSMLHTAQHEADSMATIHGIPPHSFLKEKLLLLEIRQQYGMDYVSDSVRKYLKTDPLGRVYCDDGKRVRFWYSNNMSTSLIAYRIIKNDPLLQHLKTPLQLYILSTKQNGWNTYRSSSAVHTLLADLLQAPLSGEKLATIALKGKERKTISEFPYSCKLMPGESLHVEKKAGMPLIVSDYKERRVRDAESNDLFEITTELPADTLLAGIPVSLRIHVTVKERGAEHVMIEVPIPASCTYVDETREKYGVYGFGNETYREYFKEKTVIFCTHLPVGKHEFRVDIVPRYTGSYILNPAKIELMYFPVINANNEIKRVVVEEQKK